MGGVLLLLAGCHEAYRGNNEEAILAAALAVPAAVAAGAVQAQQAHAGHDRPVDPSLLEPLQLRTTTTCGARSYSLYCTMNGKRCVYRTQYGFEYACSTDDCSAGAPPALLNWCGS